MACMHMQDPHCTLGNLGTQLHVRSTCVRRYSRLVSPKAFARDSSLPVCNVARLLHQHKLLMEHGFTYDQASMILQVSAGRMDPHQAGILEGSVKAEAPGAAAAAADVSRGSSQDDSSTSAPEPEQQQQQQPNLKGIEDRLSFLEMELLKQSISVDAFSSLTGAAEQGVSSSSSSVAHHGGLGPSDAAAGADNMQLDPAVLAIAESLLIRQGRVVPVLGSSSSSSSSLETADSSLYRQHQRQQQQMGGTTNTSIWGRRYASSRQIGSQRWRYPEQGFNAANSINKSPAGAHKVLPYGYLPDADMVSSHDLEVARQDDLVPYEPNGWSVAGTILLVYAGILLTFFAVIAGTAEGSGAALDPDVMMMFW